ncbi:MAG: hypothetical protein JW774_10945, partial [Candidatus Aureabacteria bacterium]|nr:hypothetical protein [Candidatus Auribacterota bacterium]
GQKKVTSEKGGYKFFDLPAGSSLLKISLKDFPYKIMKVTPKPEGFDPDKPLEELLIPVYFSKKPDTISNFNIVIEVE